MRVAVLSDIHGNYSALKATLAHIDAQGCESLWFLGDLFGRGALPVACFDLLRVRNPNLWLMGNHDMGTLLLLEGRAFDDEEVKGCAPGSEDRQDFLWHAAQARSG